MPSGPPHLQKKFGNDSVASELLEKAGYKMDKGFVYHPPTKDHVMTPDESDAIDYLFMEWDYGYDPEPLPT